MEFSTTIAADLYHTVLSIPIFAMITKCYVMQYVNAYKALSASDILNLKDELMMSEI